MITSRNELKKCINIETSYLKKHRKIQYFRWIPMFLGLGESFGIYKLLIYLRKCEYYSNTRRLIPSIYYKYRSKAVKNRFSIRIPINVFDVGLQIPHLGPIVVHPKIKFGKNCRIHVGVNIGAKKDEAPVIGDDCYIGPRAKIFGGIIIGDKCKIGANAVVNKSFGNNQTIVGVPGHSVISE